MAEPLHPTTPPTLSDAPIKALVFMVAAQFFFSLMTLFIKLAHHYESQHVAVHSGNHERFGGWESVLFRCFPMMIASVFILIKRSRSGHKHPRLAPHDIQWLITRGLVGAASMACFFHGTLTVSLGLASLFVNSSVFLVGLLGHIILREKLTPARIILALGGFFGISLILGGGLFERPSSFTADAWDYIISFSAGFLSAFAYFSVRMMRSIPGNTIVLSLSASGVLLACSVFIFVRPLHWPATPRALTLLLFSSLPAMIAQFLMTRAFKTGEAGFVALGQYSGPVFATLIGYFLFAEVLTPIQCLGAVIATSFGFLLPLFDRKALGAKKEFDNKHSIQAHAERIRHP
jgi:drug/metabolite transporter (DMT)-like permease